MRLAHLIVITLSALTGVATPVQAEVPFLDLTFEAALTKAAAEDKKVFIDFYTTWCGPCKLLDRTTWKDARVQAWLNEHTVPLKIDAEKQRSLARRLKVAAYPTMVFVKPDGTAGGNIVGYVKADEFLKQAANAIGGQTNLDRKVATFERQVANAKDKFDKGPTAMARLTYGQALAQAGQHEEALAQYTWCWENGDKAAGFGGVRVSFLLSDVARLGDAYPPAKQALADWRQTAMNAVASDQWSTRHTSDFIYLARASDVPDTDLLAWYDQIKKRADASRDRSHQRNVQAAASQLQDVFYTNQRWQECLGSMTATMVLQRLDEAQRRFPAGSGPDMGDFHVTNYARIWEVMMILGSDGQADQAEIVLNGLIEFRPTEKTLKRLQKNAARARGHGASRVPTDETLAARVREAGRE